MDDEKLDQTYNERTEIIKDIIKEREYQIERWGLDFDTKNTPNDWATYIVRYLAYSVPGTEIFDHELFYKNMIKVATLAIAAAEQCKHTDGNMPPRHYD